MPVRSSVQNGATCGKSAKYLFSKTTGVKRPMGVALPPLSWGAGAVAGATPILPLRSAKAAYTHFRNWRIAFCIDVGRGYVLLSRCNVAQGVPFFIVRGEDLGT